MNRVDQTISRLSWLRDLPGKPLIVAEVKSRSPYGWVNPYTLDEQNAICCAVGDIISVHTNPLWGGSFLDALIMRVRTDKPILAKGFHDTQIDVQRAFDAGATYCLTVGWWNGNPNCWHEIEGGLMGMSLSTAPWIVYNARNPRTGQLVDSYLPHEAIGVNRCRWIPGVTKRICQASNIRCAADVVPGMDAILIGEGLYQT